MALPIKVKSGLSHSHVGKYFATALLTVRYTIFNKCHREAGVTTWGLEEKSKSIAFWDRALSYTKYDFEYRLTLVSYFARFQHHDQTTYIYLKKRVNLAVERALEQGVQRPAPNQPDKGPSTNGRSRMSKSTSTPLSIDNDEEQ
jgi:hypothetical protein